MTTREKLEARYDRLKRMGILTKEELKAGVNAFIYKQELLENKELLEKLKRSIG